MFAYERERESLHISIFLHTGEVNHSTSLTVLHLTYSTPFHSVLFPGLACFFVLWFVNTQMVVVAFIKPGEHRAVEPDCK